MKSTPQFKFSKIRQWIVLIVSIFITFGATGVDATMRLYGTFNTGSTSLAGPSGVYATKGGIDNGGNLYVVEYGSSHIYKFASTGGTALASASNLNLLFPMQIAQDSAGNIYVAANSGSKIVRYTANLTSPTTFISTSAPNGVAIDPQGNFYVTSAQKVKLYNSSGTLTATRNATGTQLAFNAMQIALDVSGNFYVADFGNARIQKFTATSNSTFASSGLANPSGVAVDSAGNVYVSDAGNNKIKKYNSSGTLLETYSTGINTPRGIFVDRNNKIYIGNTGTNKIIILLQEPIHPFGVTATPTGNSVILNWTNSSSNVTSTVIVRKTSGYPTTMSDGTVVSSAASGTSYTDSDLGVGTYYYGLFGKDTNGAYSTAPATANATVVDSTPPLAPAISATKNATNGTTIFLSWDVPSTTDHFMLKKSFNGGGLVDVSQNISASTTYNIQSGLIPGIYQYSLYAIDAYANTSNVALTSPQTIDNEPPLPVTSFIASADGSTISLSWTNPTSDFDSATLRYSTTNYPASISEGTLATQNTQATTFVKTGLADATYYFSIFVKDSFGNSSGKVTVNVVVDTSAPEAPTLNVTKTNLNGNSVALSWTTPTDTSKFMLKRRFNSDDLTVVSSNMSSSVSHLTQHGLSDGSYVYMIYAIDAYENTSNVGASSLVTIDTVAPSQPTGFIASADGSTISLSWTNPTVDFQSVTIRVSPTHNPTTITDGFLVTENSTATSLTKQDTVDGTYYYSIFAKDSFGNVSEKATANTTVDITPPPHPTAFLAYAIGQTVYLSWTNPTSDFDSATLRYSTTNYPASISEGTLATQNTQATTFVKTGLADATYYFSIFAKDSFGNSSGKVTVNVVVDTSAPEAPVLTAHKPRLNGSSIVLDWSVPASTVKLVLRQTINGNESLVSSNISPSQTRLIQTELLDGSYAYSLRAVDGANNTSNASVADVLIIDTSSPSTPSIAVEKTATHSILLTWSAPTGTDKFVLKRSKNDGQFELLNESLSSSTLHMLQTDLTDGDYVYKVYAVDTFTNTSNAGISEKITIFTPSPDITPPISPTGFQAVANESTLTLNWINPSDAVSIILKRMISPVSPEGTLITENVLIHSYTFRNLSDGAYHFGVFAKDGAGNISDIARASGSIDTAPTLTKLVSRRGLEKGNITVTTNVTTAIVDQEIAQNASSATLNIAAVYKSAGTKLGVGTGAIGHILIASNNASWSDAGNVKIGSNGGQGKVVQSNGTVEILGKLQLGSDGSSSGNYTLSGGVLKTSTLEIGSIGGSGTFQWTGGSLQTKTVAGNLNNQGGTLVIYSDTPVTITGNYTQSGSGAVSFALKATNGALARSTGSLADAEPLLNATGTTTLEGTISISISGYTAKPGDKIYLVNRSQTSSMRLTSMKLASDVHFDLPALDSRLSWDTTAFETEGILSVVGSGSSLINDRPLNYPNPFKLSTGTDIGYWLNTDADIELRVYMATGVEVYRKSLVSGVDSGAKSGYNKVHISAAEVGSNWPSGVYPYVLINNGKTIGNGRMVVRPE